MPRVGQRVGGDGSPAARYVLVGEAPGEDEAEEGRPFVGRSGKVMWDVLKNVGVDRRQCYVTNVIKEWPGPGNNLNRFWSAAYGFTHLAQPYLEELADELNNTRANVIVALGNTALDALCGKTSILNNRGSTFASTLKGLESRKILAALHPSGAARFYLYTWVLAFDAAKMVRQSGYPELRRPERQHLIARSVGDAIEFIKLLSADHTKITSVDIEQVDHELSSIAFCQDPGTSYVIPFLRSIWDDQTRDHLLLIIKAWLENASFSRCFHNAMYDVSELERASGILVRGRLEDTMIRQHLLYPDLSGREKKLGNDNPIGGKRLQFITSVYTDEPFYKDEGAALHWGDETMYFEYNGKDACVTQECLPQLQAKALAQGQEQTFQRTVAALPNLVKMQLRGLRMDKDAIQKLQEVVSRERLEKRSQLDEIVREKLDNPLAFVSPTSNPQLINYFYGELAKTPYRKKGKVTVDETALRMLATTHGLDEARLVLELRGLQKILGTYAKIKLDKDGRFRYSINICGTKTSRLSTEKTLRKTGTNIQNQPPAFRHCFVADEGKILVSRDYGGAEWMIAAYLTQDPNMLAAISVVDEHQRLVKKGDPHQKTADFLTDFLGRPFPRKQAKTVNFSFNYGMTHIGFARRELMSLGLAHRIRQGYLSLYPGIETWWEAIRAELAFNKRMLTNCFGRVRTFRNRWGQDLFKEAYDWEPQSTVGDMLLDVFADKRFNQVDALAQIHDEVLFQAGISTVDEESQLVGDIMHIPLTINGHTFYIPQGVKVGYSWGNMVELTPGQKPSELLKHLEV